MRFGTLPRPSELTVTDNVNQSRSLSLLIAGGLSALLGTVVLAGWYTHTVVLVQVHPAFVPMQYNTALGFFLAGLSLLALSTGGRRAVHVAGSAVGAIGFLTLMQFIFGSDFHIDQLFMEHYTTVKTSHPGRMAPNTALCFLLTAVSVVVFVRSRGRGVALKCAGMIAAITAALGLVAFFGYLSSLETAYGWGHLTRMAVHTSAGFVCLGSGLLLHSWTQLRGHGTDRLRWLAVPAGVTSITVVVVLWQALSAQAGLNGLMSMVVLAVGLALAALVTSLVHYVLRAKTAQVDLLEEIHVRHEAERELQQHRDHLDELVRERTAEADLSRQAAEEAQHRAETANNARSSFLANMSHEVRTPLNAILGFAEILSDRIHDKQQKGYLDSIQASGKSLMALLNDILDLSKIEQGTLSITPRPSDIHALFADVEATFNPRARERGLELSIQVDPGVPAVLVVDDDRLRQVVANLVDNGIKFTRDGHVRITVAGSPKAEGKNCVDLMIVISDTGIGIPDDQRENIFGLFKQREGQNINEYSGVGRGLSLVAALLDAMDGDITVESQLGVGSTFTIALRDVAIASKEDSARTTTDDLDIDSISFNHATLLLADDVGSNRELVKTFLDSQPFEFFEADNGEEAIALARQHRPALVLMDIKMPVLDGFSASKRLKADEQLKQIPVIALTGSVLRESEHEILQVCDGLLRKPVARRELVSEMSLHLAHVVLAKGTPAAEPESGGPSTWSADSLTEEQRGRLSELATTLRTRRSMWEELSQTLTINDVDNFGQSLQSLGLEYDYEPLIEWSEKLSAQAGGFDMEGMRETLGSFPAMIEEIGSVSS